MYTVRTVYNVQYTLYNNHCIVLSHNSLHHKDSLKNLFKLPSYIKGSTVTKWVNNPENETKRKRPRKKKGDRVFGDVVNDANEKEKKRGM